MSLQDIRQAYGFLSVCPVVLLCCGFELKMKQDPGNETMQIFLVQSVWYIPTIPNRGNTIDSGGCLDTYAVDSRIILTYCRC